MKKERIKVFIAIAFIILVFLIATVGIYIRVGNEDINKMPEYELGMDILGHRQLQVEVDKTETEVEEDGSKVTHTETEEEHTHSKVPKNIPENLTTENFKKAKEIIEKRLIGLEAVQYKIRANESTGEIAIELPEDEYTNGIVEYLTLQGKFQIIDSETKEVLLSNINLKTSKPGYSNSEPTQADPTIKTSVFVVIEFDDESIKKLEEISSTYVSSTNEAGETVKKQITLMLDEVELFTTYFGETLKDGKLQILIGTSTNNEDELNNYFAQASNISMLINKEMLPIVYEQVENKFISEEFDYTPIIVILSLVFVITSIMLFKYKKLGVLAILSSVGYLSILTIIVKIVRITLTIENLFAVAILIVINYFVLKAILKSKESIKDASFNILIKELKIIVPILLISMVFVFDNWLPIASFGMMLFWGILLQILYNLIVTRCIFKNTSIGGKTDEKH